MNLEDVWENQSAELLADKLEVVLTVIDALSVEEDLKKLKNSSTSRLADLKHQPLYLDREEYQTANIPPRERRIWFQLRLASLKCSFVLGQGPQTHKCEPKSVCQVSHHQSMDTIDHFLLVCPQLTHLRQNHIHKHLRDLIRNEILSQVGPGEINLSKEPRPGPNSLHRLLSTSGPKIIKDMYNYSISALRTRALILDI